jgi:membrane associated rhomboid family serine protease
MDIVLFPQHWAAILCIGIMIGAIVIAYIKKIMLSYVLIITNILIFIIELFFGNEIINGIDPSGLGGLGFRPIYLTPNYFPQLYTLFTSMFIHANFAHIFGNMFVFFFVGTALEERIGWNKFLIIYLATGVFGALTQSLISLGSGTSLIGASGAIFGVMGALAYSFPRDEVVMPVGIGIMFITKIKVIYAVLIFVALETFLALFFIPGDNTAHFAHLGGFFSGAIIAALIVKNKKVDSSMSFKTVYTNPFIKEKPGGGINLDELNKLAITPELKEILKKIKNETVQQVRDLWLEHFLDKTVCPKCKNNLSHFDKKIWCEKCGFRTSY